MRRADGFSIVELLVALLISSVVFTGALAAMGTQFNQSYGTVQRTDAMQRGRVELDQITRLLRAQVCGDTVTRVVPGAGAFASDESQVTFFGDLSGGRAAPSKHVLALDAGRHEISDTVFAGSGSAANGYTFAATGVKRVLADAAYAAPGTPFLEYHAYPTPLVKPYAPSAVLAVPLTLATARRVAQIQVAFLSQPTNVRRQDRGTVLQDQVAVRAADPSQEDPNPYDCTSLTP
jgi:prepilin-type N-terminal cleavage/methylation domain-containing protein